MAAGIGEAASIAGLFGLAGQTVQAASTLYRFVQAYKNVSIEIASTTEEIVRLENVLCHAQKLAADTPVSTLLSPDIVAALEKDIGLCRSDLQKWNEEVESLKHTQISHPRKVLNKLKIASDKGFFLLIRAGISKHLKAITAILGLLDW